MVGLGSYFAGGILGKIIYVVWLVSRDEKKHELKKVIANYIQINTCL